MARITLEFWMGMGETLGGEFRSPSEISSVLETEVAEGISVTTLFCKLADQYSPVREKVFDRTKNQFHPNVVVTYNDRVIGLKELHEKILKDGDKLRVVPMYHGW